MECHCLCPFLFHIEAIYIICTILFLVLQINKDLNTNIPYHVPILIIVPVLCKT